MQKMSQFYSILVQISFVILLLLHVENVSGIKERFLLNKREVQNVEGQSEGVQVNAGNNQLPKIPVGDNKTEIPKTNFSEGSDGKLPIISQEKVVKTLGNTYPVEEKPHLPPIVLNTTTNQNKIQLPAAQKPTSSNTSQKIQTSKTDTQLVALKDNATTAPIKIDTHINGSSHNVTATKAPTQLDLSNPGVLKRGLIVFSGFALLAGAYYVFFKRGKNKNDTNASHNTNDTNQFRYGVLQSDDQRDNLELSRVPLTMESDEDDDDDLEIFDLGQKKHSLSYVNLQPTDDEFETLNSFTEKNQYDSDHLLLDIGEKS